MLILCVRHAKQPSLNSLKTNLTDFFYYLIVLSVENNICFVFYGLQCTNNNGGHPDLNVLVDISSLDVRETTLTIEFFITHCFFFWTFKIIYSHLSLTLLKVEKNNWPVLIGQCYKSQDIGHLLNHDWKYFVSCIV